MTLPVPDRSSAVRRANYTPAVTPRLRRLLILVFVLVALIGANSLYLAAVTALEYFRGTTYQNFFYQYMFLAHLVLGLLLIVPFLVFAVVHLRNTWRRKNRHAVRMGYALFAAGLILLATGLLLTRRPARDSLAVARSVFYWLHVIAPLVIIWLYWLHRLAGPPIKWRLALGYLAGAGLASVAMIGLHASDPRPWYQVGSQSGVKYFEPSLARTSTGKFLSQHVLMDDAYCVKCHADAHAAWAQRPPVQLV